MANVKQEEKKYNFSSVDLLIYIWEKRVPLIIITIIAGLASIFISFMITPKFRSTVVMFPTTNTSVSKNLLSNNYSGNVSMYQIGEEQESEQLMQILYSEEIRDRIIEKYNLMEHYDIDSSSSFPLTKLYNTYKENIRPELTQYLSIEVNVLDEDPQIAADIANDIAMYVDSVYNRMLKTRAVDAFAIVNTEYKSVQKNIESLQDTLSKIRALGINHYETQSERYNEGLAKAIVEGNSRAQREFEKKLEVLNLYGSNYEIIHNELLHEVKRLSEMRQKYQEAKVEAEQNLSHIFIVDSAYKAEKKAYPKKSIIVIISTFSTFLLALISLIIIDNIKEKTIV